MGLRGKKRQPITHRRCFQVIHSLKDRLVLERKAREISEARLEARIKKLEARLKQDSSNSSRPPSSDFPHRKYPRRTPSGRKSGGQKGHPGQFRALIPVEEVSDVIVVKPTQCEHCRSDFLQGLGKFIRHQVTELPEIELVVTEYQRYIFRCRSCGKKTVAALPPGVPHSRWGFRMQAFATFGVGKLGLSKRKIVALLEHGFGFKTSVASVVRHEAATSCALAGAYEEAQGVLETEPSAHVDETGWKEKNQPAWLWGAKTSQVTVYRIDPHRSREARNKLIGKFDGVLISDQLSTYADWKMSKWQLCWAHIRRYLKCFSESEGKAAEIGKKSLAVSDAVFHTFHQMKRGTMTFEALGQEMTRFQEVFHGFLADGLTCIDPAVAGTCLNLLKREEALWTFTRVPGIEPTNNAAEQALRPTVTYRKNSHGTQSETGSRFLERLFTTVETLKQNHQDILRFLVGSIRALSTGEKPPRLVPVHNSS